MGYYGDGEDNAQDQLDFDEEFKSPEASNQNTPNASTKQAKEVSTGDIEMGGLAADPKVSSAKGEEAKPVDPLTPSGAHFQPNPSPVIVPAPIPTPSTIPVSSSVPVVPTAPAPKAPVPAKPSAKEWEPPSVKVAL